MTYRSSHSTIWEAVRHHGKNNAREVLKVDVSKWAEQELNDNDPQAQFRRSRPDGFAVNEKEQVIYV